MMKFNFKPSSATPKIGLVLLQVPSNISPTSEFKETKVGDELVQTGWASKRAEGDLGTEADGVDWVTLGCLLWVKLCANKGW